MGTLGALDLTSKESLLIIANLVLIIIAVFLLVRFIISKKKNEPGKEKQTELAGIADIKPEEFKPERLELNKEILQQEKSVIKSFDAKGFLETPGKIEDTEELPEIPETISIDGRSETPENNELKLEDDLPEETVPKTVSSNIEEPEAKQIENPSAPSVIEPKAMNQDNAEKPVKKGAKKKKPARKKKASVQNAGETEMPVKEEKPKKKASKRDSLF